jgi:hypothetical protein
MIIEKLKFLIYKVLYKVHKFFFNTKFYFQGNPYSYFVNEYNSTYLNERAIEIPIATEYYNTFLKSNETLEIGNVLKRYFPELKHDVLDLYEGFEGVINEDIEFYKSAIKYKFILTVSTLEHVGFDGDEILDLDKLRRSINNITDNLLAEGGVLIATFPLKYNPSIDDLFSSNFFHEKYAMQRGFLNLWKQVSIDQGLNGKPKKDTAFVRQIGIGIFRK